MTDPNSPDRDPDPDPDLDPSKDTDQEEGGDGYDLEPSADDARPSVDGDQGCERCGAPLPEDTTRTTCPSCGLDTESGTVTDPPPSVPDSTDDSIDESVSAEKSSSDRVLLAPGHSTPWLIAAGVVAVIVVFAMLAGWSSFYPSSEGRFLDSSGKAVLDAPQVTARLVAVAKYLVGSLVLVGTALIAVRITCWFEELRPGDFRAGFARFALVVTVASLARLIGFDPTWLQSIVQLLLGAGLVVGGAILVLGRRDRTTAMFLLGWVLVVLLVIPVTRLVSWSLPLW